MSGQSRRVRYWQAGIVCLLLAGLAAYVFFGQTSSLAGSTPFTPHVAAFFKGKDRLQIAVGLDRHDLKQLTGDLRVELVNDQGKVLESADKAIKQTDPMASYGFEIPAGKDKIDKLRIRVSFQGKEQEIPLKQVVLAKAHETTLSSGQEFFVGSQTSLRCLVQGVKSVTENLPLPGSEVTVRLRDKDGKGRQLSQVKTGKDGLADVSFTIPEVPAGNYTLEVVTRSPLGQDKLERPIRLKSDAKILLVSDRPIYQPGHVIHMRALVLRPFDMKPIQNKDLLFEVEDSKGNKVFKRTFQTSEYGIAAVEFQLADEVNMGDYHLRAILGDVRAEKTVPVKRYVLPKFKVEVTADKAFYLPKEKINASVQTDYFFGKPVSGGKIQVTASTFDFQFRNFQTWEGKTDANGHAKFDIQLPDYFVGQPLQKGNAVVKLDIKATDTADHTETVSRTYTVSDQSIRVSLIPEGGRLVPGMETRIFAAAIYPDGSPAACDVKLWLGKEAKGKPLATVKTNAAGLAEFRLTPKAEQFRQGNWGQRDIEMLGGKQQGWGPAILLDVRAEAKDAKGNKAFAVAELNSQPLGENVLLRLDKAIYQTGDSLNVDIRTSAGLPTVYLDIVRGGQVMLSRWLEVKEGQAAQRLDLPQSVFGSLEVHAYQMLASGEIIRDSRVVYVQPRNDLKIDVKADQKEYLPGESGRIRFVVTDSAGKPAQAAIGIIIVDEAVYALQEMQPGLEKVYFTLQEELLKPQVQIKFSDSVDNLVRQPVLPAPRQQVAEVLLTSVKLPPRQRWEVNPALERKQKLEGQIAGIGQVLFNYAWNQAESVIVFDKNARRWDFKAGLLEEMVKKNQFAATTLDAPLGGKLTLDDLAKIETSFTADRLARGMTLQRMHQLHWSVIHYTNGKKAQFFKDGKWTFPKTVLAAAAKQQGLDGRWLKDAWGEPLQMVKRAKKIDHQFGHTQFDYHEIVSAGPDRKAGTKDDVRMANWNEFQQYGWIGHFWWLTDDTRLGAQKNRFGMLRDRMMRNRMLEMERMPRGGGFPNAPMAAKNGQINFRPAKTEGAPGGLGGGAGGDNKGGGAPPLKIREYFPETMLWMPALITDKQGIADLAVNFADSITTWRLTASASSRVGGLGGAQVPLKVFQDFFVDIDLPVSLTQSDEVSFPIVVYNYLKTPQTVKLELKQEAWFELLDGGPVRSIDLQPNEVTGIKFRIRANKIGFQPLTVKAFGSKKSDAVKRVVEVVPNGQRIEKVASDRLSGKAKQVIDIPQNALPDASKLIVRIYPGVMAQVIEGVEGMIRLPGG